MDEQDGEQQNGDSAPFEAASEAGQLPHARSTLTASM